MAAYPPRFTIRRRVGDDIKDSLEPRRVGRHIRSKVDEYVTPWPRFAARAGARQQDRCLGSER